MIILLYILFWLICAVFIMQLLLLPAVVWDCTRKNRDWGLLVIVRE